MTAAGFDLRPVGDREIAITRRFAAPPALVWDAWTRPALVRRWLTGPQGWTMPVCEIDLAVGGRIRYVWRHADGREMGLSGTFREIVPNTRLVHTELFDEDWTGGETLVTTTFAATAEGTVADMSVLYASAEARDGALRSGMEAGIGASYDRLDPILALDADATRLVSLEARQALVVRKTIPFAEIPAAQRAARPLLEAALREAGLGDAGPRLTVWRTPGGGTIDYAPGILVPRTVPAKGDVSLLTLPAGRAAHLRLRGAFAGLPAAWARLFDECAAEGWTPAGLNWEVYGDEATAEPVTDLYAALSIVR